MTQSIIEELSCSSSTQNINILANHTLFCLGEKCDHYVIVKSGTVRVELLSTTGQQLLLYRIQEGQSCVMTTSCLLSKSRYFAQAISETPVDLMLIPQAQFHSNLMESHSFRDFVFKGFSERLAAMLERTADLATRTVDQRLAAALLAHNIPDTQDHLIRLTHGQLAVEIGSAREVVSRRLALFAKDNLIEQQRGTIKLINPEKLVRLINQ